MPVAGSAAGIPACGPRGRLTRVPCRRTCGGVADVDRVPGIAVQFSQANLLFRLTRREPHGLRRRRLVVGVGIDIVYLKTFRARLSDELVDELFLPSEVEYCRSQARSWEAFGARLAAKEALFKALGAGLAQGIRWKDVEILREPSGEPQLSLKGTALEVARDRGAGRWLLSLTHSRESAAAVVVLDSHPAKAE